jgi:hypothetical protein
MEQGKNFDLLAAGSVCQRKWQGMNDDFSGPGDAAYPAQARVMFQQFDCGEDPFEHSIRRIFGFLS